MKRFNLVRSALGLGVAISLSACTQNKMAASGASPRAPVYQVSKTLPIGGEGRWDYVTFDSAANVLYVPRSTHTQVIDPKTGKVLADIPDTVGVHGVAIATKLGRGFISNGKAGNVAVIDLKTNDVIGTIPAGSGPDAITFDPSCDKVFCMNAKSHNVTVIDATADPGKDAVLGTIALSSNPESAVVDGRGKLFVNLEDGNALAEIDIQTMKVLATWPLDGGEGPTGLAIDPGHHVLFVGCRNQRLLVIDADTGKVLQKLPIGAGVDCCAFDAGTGEAFASCGDGTITGVHRTTDGSYQIVQKISTQIGARTMTIDPATHVLYLPTSEFERKAAGEHYPKMKAGTFVIVVVSPAKG
jgi:YVTN family beta-propeller protein